MLPLLVSLVVIAAEPPALWIPGDNFWGAHGLYRVEAAHGPSAGSLVMLANSELAYEHGLLAANDTRLLSKTGLHVMWAPSDSLSLGLGARYIDSTYDSFLHLDVRQLGSPEFDAKYTWSNGARHADWAFGVAVHAMVPTSPSGHGLVGEALTLGGQGVATYRVHEDIEISVNVGYQLDNSQRFLNSTLADVTRAALSIGGPQHGLTWGVGYGARVPLTRNLEMGPFAELSGLVGDGLPLAANPARVTGGAKLYAAGNHRVEAGVGVDVRLAGGLRSDSPGIAPWDVFAQLSLHFFDADTLRCDDDAACPTGQSCENHVCVAVRTVDHESFTLSGVVLDAETGQPVKDVSVTISAFKETPIAVDNVTGAFKSFPIPVGPGTLQVTANARGYNPSEVTLARPASRDTKTILLGLSREAAPRFGNVRGVVKDAATGKPVKGAQVFVPQGDQRDASGADGAFNVRVRTGMADVFVSAPGYHTQRLRFMVDTGDDIIVNVDFVPNKAR